MRSVPDIEVLGAGLGSPLPGLERGWLDVDLLADDDTRLETELRAAKPAVVVNCTGAVTGSTADLVRLNVTTTARVVEALARSDLRTRLIHIGSAAEYGPGPAGEPVTESASRQTGQPLRRGQAGGDADRARCRRAGSRGRRAAGLQRAGPLDARQLPSRRSAATPFRGRRQLPPADRARPPGLGPRLRGRPRHRHGRRGRLPRPEPRRAARQRGHGAGPHRTRAGRGARPRGWIWRGDCGERRRFAPLVRRRLAGGRCLAGTARCSAGGRFTISNRASN